VAYCKKSKSTTDRRRGQRHVLEAHMNGPTPVDYVNMSVEAVTGRLTGEATYVQCIVAGKPITLLLDTGARASILNKATVNKLQL
jgi:predicted aspartyl protease